MLWQPEDNVALGTLSADSGLARNDVYRLYAVLASVNLQFAENCVGFYPTACHMNHACLPSARCVYHRKGGRLEVVAVRDVAQGEEVTISFVTPSKYGKTMYEAELVRQLLWSMYRFRCACDAHATH